MGLDGISINQLRVTPENNSNELNIQARFSLNNETRAVDGLTEGQRVDPDKEQEHEKQELKKQYASAENEEETEDQTTVEPVEKYDLSRSDKYSLKIEESTNNVLIIEKNTKKIIQRIDADELSQFVKNLADPRGSIINRKF